MDVFAANSGGSGTGLTRSRNGLLIPELSGLALQASLHLLFAPVLESAVLDSEQVVGVLLGKNLAVEDRLDRGVVVVLVNLLVHGGLNLLVTGGLDGLVGHGGSNLLVDGGVMMTSLGPEKEVRTTSARGRRPCWGGRR